MLRTRPLQLLADGKPAGLQPQPTRALLYLVERAGELVSRDELRRHLWGLGTHLDHEQGINFTIRRIRAVLEDDPKCPRFLETVPRQGYRFVADVERGAQPPGAVHSRRGRWRVAVGVLAVLLPAVAWLSSAYLGEDIETPSPSPTLDNLAADVPLRFSGTYVRARYLISRGDRDHVEQGIALLEEAAEAAPDSAAIHLALAEGYINRDDPGLRDFMLAAAAAAQRALELRADLAEAHRILGSVNFFCHYDWQATARHLSEALRLDPGLATAHHLHGLYLSALGRHDEAVAAIRRAVHIDPESLFAVSDLAETLFRARHWDEAVQQARHLLTVEPASPSGHWIVIDTLLWLGNKEEALAQIQSFYRSNDLEPPVTVDEALHRGLRYLERLRDAGNPQFSAEARFALAVGRREEAIDLLIEGCRAADWDLPYVAVSPRFDALRDHPRWQSIPCLAPH